MEIIKKVDNKFLNRTELDLKIPHKNQPTPTREWLKSEIAKEFKAEMENIKIKYIFSQKNRDYSIAKVHIFSDKNQKKDNKNKTQDKS